MKYLQQLLVCSIAFLPKIILAQNPSLSGSYSVISCEPANETSHFAIELKSDRRFLYVDSDNPNQKIQIEGHWELFKDRLVLSADVASAGMRRQWKVLKEGMCIRSRVGMKYIRLCKPCGVSQVYPTIRE